MHIASQNGDENMIRTLYLARANATITDNEGKGLVTSRRNAVLDFARP